MVPGYLLTMQMGLLDRLAVVIPHPASAFVVIILYQALLACYPRA